MNEIFEFVLRVLIIGIGATIVMDLWTLILKQFGIKSLNYAYLGRWIGHIPQGRWIHKNIANTTPIKGELFIGWCAHYSIGIAFAALLVAIFGLKWTQSPSLLPALFIGIVTVVAPYFILQPGLGAGIASSKTPTPNFNRIKSLITHIIFGFGLYLSALVAKALISAAPLATKNVIFYIQESMMKTANNSIFREVI